MLCLSSAVVFGQSSLNYQPATITAVKPHHPVWSSFDNYEVSLKVNETVYVVLYKPPVTIDSVKYETGRQLLVLVGEKTITYNDILGQSFEVPIVRRMPSVETNQPK